MGLGVFDGFLVGLLRSSFGSVGSGALVSSAVAGGSVGRGSFVGSASSVGSGSVVDVNGGGAVVAAGGGVTDAWAGVDEGESFGVSSSVGTNVPIAVRIMGVDGVEVTRELPPWISGHSCRATGNCRQFVLSEQMFKSKEVCCAPRQMRIRWPFTTLAVKHVTGDVETTSK